MDDYERFCQGLLADPYPLLAELRRREPVHWSDRLDAWLITRYDDVATGLANPNLANDRIAAYMAALTPERRERYAGLGEHISGWLGFTDPPKHTRLRAIVREYFTPKLAEDLRPSIEQLVDAILDDAATKEVVDLVRDVAFRLPSAVIYQILALEGDTRDEFKVLTDAVVPFTGNIGPTLNDIAPGAHAAVLELKRFFEQLVDDRSAHPGSDLISRLSVLVRAGELSRQEVISLCVFVFVAGFETTSSGIATGLMLLLTRPEAAERIRREGELIAPAVEEIFRYESPIQMSVRVARERMIINGQSIGPGATVLLSQGAADRDPDRFPDPDLLDIRRSPNRHLAFGWSAHFCLGAPLARIETQVMVSKFLQRFPRARISGWDGSWVANMSIRCPTSLPTVVVPG